VKMRIFEKTYSIEAWQQNTVTLTSLKQKLTGKLNE